MHGLKFGKFHYSIPFWGGGESMCEIVITLGSVNVHSYHMCVVYPMFPTFDNVNTSLHIRRYEIPLFV